MLVAYIAHPYSAPTHGERRANAYDAAGWALFAFDCGLSPSCSWLTLVAHCEETPEARVRGLAADIAQVRRSEVLLLCGPRISEGMQIEAGHARLCGVPVLDLVGLSRHEARARIAEWMTPPADADLEVRVAT